MQANRCHLRTFLPQYMDYHLRYMVISMVARHPLYRHQNKVIFFPLVSLLLPLLEDPTTSPILCHSPPDHWCASIVPLSGFLTIMVDPSCLPGCDNASYPGMSVFQII